MADGNGTLVIGELVDGAPASATLETIAAARALGDGPVGVMLAGASIGDAAQTAIAHGADAVYAVESAVLASDPAAADAVGGPVLKAV